MKIVYSSKWSQVKQAIMDYDWRNTKFSSVNKNRIEKRLIQHLTFNKNFDIIFK